MKIKRLAALCLIVVAALKPAHGLGQAPDQTQTPADTSPPAVVANEPAPPAVTSEPAPLPAPATPAVPLRFYGILWTSALASQPVQSFGQPNSSAPTSAINPAIDAHRDDGTLSFQVQQTRAGVVVGEGTAFKGTLEIDFIHFDQSTPFAQAYPRIRIALLEWKLKEKQKLFMGQTWDIFGNATGPQLLSHSFNLVGTLFQAGNIGFMRPQLGWMGQFGDLEIASAVGAPQNNITGGPAGVGSYNNAERGGIPTGSLRLMYHLPDSMGVIGASGIATNLRYTDKASGHSHYRTSAAAQLFADVTFGGLNLHSEVYLAQNLANAGSLNLSQGRYDQDIQDVGGYLSGKYTRGNHSFTAMGGTAKVLNASKVVPGYTSASSTGTTLVPAAINLAAGPGITSNMTAHVGYWYSPLKGLSIVLEPYVYSTKFKINPADHVASNNVAWGGMFGSMFQF